jgi:hypothetical protein
VIVHILKSGLPLCGFTRDVPRDWPDGHKFVSIMEDRSPANCTECIAAAPPAPEQAAKVRRMLSKLRCVVCGQSPTEAEVEEMFENFGAKVKPGDKLLRRCKPCTYAVAKAAD